MGLFLTSAMRDNNFGKREIYARIKQNPIEIRRVEKDCLYFYNARISEANDIDDTYIALDGYGQEGIVKSDTYTYPERFLDWYLRNIDFVKNALFPEIITANTRLNDIILRIARCHWQIGSETFMQILHDIGKEDMIDDDTEKILPILDFYKHFDLVKYFNEEHVDGELAFKHQKLLNKLLKSYPFLDEYYNEEINKTKEMYEEILLRMYFYIYVIKYGKLPKSERVEDQELLEELNRNKNIIIKQKVLSDEVLVSCEANAKARFLSIFTVTDRQKKKLVKRMEEYK